jgi:hypothetical protein
MSDLDQYPELRSLLPSAFDHTHVWGYKQIWRLYGLLSPAQRLASRNGGVRLSGHQMSPPQRRQFTQWLMLGGEAPDIPETEYAAGAITLRVDAAQELEIAWSVGDRTTSWRRWLALDRDWLTGAPGEWDTGQSESLVGRPAPSLTLRDLDGRLRTLPLPEGRSFLAYFRETWVVPYVGQPPDTHDFALLVNLLARRPDLRERIAVIFPREPVNDLRAWLAASGFDLPAYADETGAITRAYGSGPLPRAVVIGPDQRVALIRTGYDEVAGTDWESALRP